MERALGCRDASGMRVFMKLRLDVAHDQDRQLAVIDSIGPDASDQAVAQFRCQIRLS